MSGWISVEERLPEEGLWVLVVYVEKHGRFIDIGVHRNDGVWSVACLEPNTVTHWMPLPELPGSADDDK